MQCVIFNKNGASSKDNGVAYPSINVHSNDGYEMSIDLSVEICIDECADVQKVETTCSNLRDGYWISLFSLYYPDNKQYNILGEDGEIVIDATAKNMEIYTGDGGIKDRAYSSTCRGEKVFMDAHTLDTTTSNTPHLPLYRFTIKKEHLSCAIDGPGHFRNLFFKVLSMQSADLLIKGIRIKLAEKPDPSNLTLPIEKRSASAAGGKGGVPEIDPSALLGMLVSMKTAANTGLTTMKSGRTISNPENMIRVSNARTPCANEEKPSVLPDAMNAPSNTFLHQIGQLMDAKLTPLTNKLHELCLKIDKLENALAAVAPTST